ncbi:MAG: hypothetical protein ACLR4A_02375 [Christensenellales bacterium]
MEAGILLYNITGQKAILSVLMMLVSQGADYTSLFHAFPYRTPISARSPRRSCLTHWRTRMNPATPITCCAAPPAQTCAKVCASARSAAC